MTQTSPAIKGTGKEKGQKRKVKWGKRKTNSESNGELDLVNVSPIARRVARAGKYSNGSLLYIYLPRNGLINVRLYIWAIFSAQNLLCF